VILICTAIWWGYLIRGVSIGPTADPSAQWILALTDPGHVVATIWQTLYVQGPYLAEQFIGILGWNDIRFSEAFLYFAAVVFVLTLLSAAGEAVRAPLWALAVIFAGVMALCLTFYFYWSKPGSLIDGLQGRYFLPLGAMLSLALRPTQPAIRVWTLPLATVALLLFALAEPRVIIGNVISRYYL
jgi:uncharacterized membrane protein